MRIATWNVNSIKQRLEHLLAFLRSAEPDVVCLQETEMRRRGLSRAEVEAAGYNVATHGQKAYNGVAILSKRRSRTSAAACPATRPTITPATSRPRSRRRRSRPRRLDLPAQRQSRPTPRSTPTSSPGWTGCTRHARDLLALEEPLVLAGDYNVIPEPARRRRSRGLGRRCPVPAGEPRAFRALINLGLTDAFRACNRRRRRSTRSGTIRPAPGSGTTASASTISCSRRRPPTASAPRRSARRREAGTSRRTTSRR